MYKSIIVKFFEFMIEKSGIPLNLNIYNFERYISSLSSIIKELDYFFWFLNTESIMILF